VIIVSVYSEKIGSGKVLKYTIEIVKAHLASSDLKKEHAASLIRTVHSTLTELVTKEN